MTWRKVKMVIKQIEKTIKHHDLIKGGQHIVLGLSGGPDSVCLFHALLRLSDKYGYKLHPVHVNHRMRPGAAEVDQEYTEKLCTSFGLRCKVFTEDCNGIAERLGISSEEAGRKVRYEAFAQVADELQREGVSKDMIVTAVAQNRDDRAETLLFRLIRGTGTDGLASISYERDDGYGRNIVRPLMDVYRKDIEAYVHQQGLNPRIDGTNLQPLYSRNRIRLGLIPYIEREFNPSIKESLNRLADVADEDRDYFRQEAQRVIDNIIIKGSEDEIRVSNDGLKKCHPAIRHRVVSQVLFMLGLTENVAYSHFHMVDMVVDSDSPSGMVNLPEEYLVEREYGHLIFRKKDKVEESNTLCIDKKVMNIEQFKDLKLENGRYAAFDLDLLKEKFGLNIADMIRLRSRQPGDWMKVGENSSKKIKKMLIDMKIPRYRRDDVQLLAAGDQILWLGYEKIRRFSCEYKVNTYTKNVLCIEFI